MSVFVARYDRQMRIDGWGVEGQRKLREASVAIVGIGGLGCPVALYLTAAGIGRLKLIDADVVDESNLNRQVLHWTSDIGRPKPESAREKLQQLNSDVEINIACDRLTDENADVVLGDVDVIVDALDNFPTRFVVNSYAVRSGKPLFHGAVWGLEGRATTILPGQTACLSCIFKASPPAEVFPVVGTTPGIVAMIQATEVIKYFTGIGQLLLNRYLIYDGEAMSFHIVRLKRDPNCPVCGFSGR
ncbi:MAG: HesA/MoeB/ThiF family protein [Armatimonadota bacterium]|nr:HesA/MoeB/ThiF family protein [Armatimonadota bacterium]MCX7776809.1 HesA/MoeB/ThiF family protein [Armatimonadota bacterium]MDW8024605.1 HesA/MoeB/ThiF family protein [Armatimonadota bacterium]